MKKQPTKIRISQSQLDKLADLSLGLGQLFFGSIVVPYVVPNLEKPPLIVLLFGIITAVGLWIFAIWIVKGKR